MNKIKEPIFGTLSASSNEIFSLNVVTKLFRSDNDSCDIAGEFKNLSTNDVATNRGR